MRTNYTETIYHWLRGLIREHKLDYRYRLPSERKIADRFGCSAICAKNALLRLEKENFIVRLRGSGSFINTEFIKSGKNPDNVLSPRIAVLLPMIFSRFLFCIYQSINEYFRQQDIFCRFFYFRSRDEEDSLLRTIYEQKYDGLLLYPVESVQPSETLLHLVEHNFPIVLVDRYFKGLDIYTVSSNHFACSRKITEYLSESGRKNICFISEPPDTATSIQHRYSGYHSIIKHDLQLRNGCTSLFYVKNYAEPFSDKLKKHFMQYPKTDAVITNSGILTVFLLNVLKELNKKPGTDVILALFDEEIEFDQLIDFSYIKINQMPQQIGLLSAELLFSQLKGMPNPVKQHTVPTSIERING